MAKGAYIGVDGNARKVKSGYVGVDGVARKIKNGYIGVEGVARQCLSGGIKLVDFINDMTFVKSAATGGTISNAIYISLDALNTGETAYMFTLCRGKFAVHEVTRGSATYKTIFRSDEAVTSYQSLYIDSTNWAWLSASGTSSYKASAGLLLLVRFPSYSQAEVEEFFSKLVFIQGSGDTSNTAMNYNVSGTGVTDSNLIVVQEARIFGVHLWDYETKTATEIMGSCGVTYKSSKLYVGDGGTCYGNIVALYYPDT